MKLTPDAGAIVLILHAQVKDEEARLLRAEADRLIKGKATLPNVTERQIRRISRRLGSQAEKNILAKFGKP